MEKMNQPGGGADEEGGKNQNTRTLNRKNTQKNTQQPDIHLIRCFF